MSAGWISAGGRGPICGWALPCRRALTCRMGAVRRAGSEVRGSAVFRTSLVKTSVGLSGQPGPRRSTSTGCRDEACLSRPPADSWPMKVATSCSPARHGNADRVVCRGGEAFTSLLHAGSLAELAGRGRSPNRARNTRPAGSGISRRPTHGSVVAPGNPGSESGGSGLSVGLVQVERARGLRCARVRVRQRIALRVSSQRLTIWS